MIFLNILADIPCFWLWLLGALGAFLLGWLLNWLLFGRGKQAQLDVLQREKFALDAEYKEMESSIAGLKYQIEQAKEETSKVKKDLYKCESDQMVLKGKYAKLERQLKEETDLTDLDDDHTDTTEDNDVSSSDDASNEASVSMGRAGDASGLSYGSMFVNDNLQVVEGIGPEIEKLLKESGINDWGALAKADQEQLTMILKGGGSRFQMHNPESWPKQAGLANNGNWEGLLNYQKVLDGGSQQKGDFDTPTKIEQLVLQMQDTAAAEKPGNKATSTTTASKLPYGNIFESDNLQIIEGIGPKIESLLKDAGIKTWEALAETDQQSLGAILEKAGSRYRMHDPKSWPEQARLAHNDDWEGLVNYQKFLDGGSDKKGDFNSPSKVEKLGMKILGFSNNPEDLKIVEGIGPKIEQLLKNAGIHTWAELSQTSITKIQKILDDAGDRYRLADPGTWPRQAELAANGDWSALSDYQDYLDGGKDPGKTS